MRILSIVGLLALSVAVAKDLKVEYSRDWQQPFGLYEIDERRDFYKTRSFWFHARNNDDCIKQFKALRDELGLKAALPVNAKRLEAAKADDLLSMDWNDLYSFDEHAYRRPELSCTGPANHYRHRGVTGRFKMSETWAADVLAQLGKPIKIPEAVTHLESALTETGTPTVDSLQ